MRSRRLSTALRLQQVYGAWQIGFLVGVFATLTSFCAEAADPTAQLLRPTPYEVFQREGFVPHQSHIHAVGGPQRGSAQVTIQGEFPSLEKERFQYRVINLPLNAKEAAPWQSLDIQRAGEQKVNASAEILAGGWYRLEVRQLVNTEQRNLAAVEPFGVGEVFLIAGQSYAAGANDELQRVEDPLERVSAFDPIKRTWQVANDPQPNVGDGGTIWPPLGDALLPFWEVPIGLVNVAVGGTASREWLPGTEQYERLACAGTDVGKFRAVLWQQGESDVIEKVKTATYVKNLVTIRTALAQHWKQESPWLLAKSTLHPEVYKNPAGEAEIRDAIEQLWALPGFRPGPDTDILAGENRGGPGSRKHFSRLGQRRAARLWFAAVWHEFQTAPALPEQAADAKEEKAEKEEATDR